MAHFKRGRRKDVRSGCLWCKYHKSTGYKDTFNCQTRQEQKARVGEREQVDEVRVGDDPR